jgi:hypothetical protein
VRRRDRQGFGEISVGFGERERRAHCVVPMLNPKPLMERERCWEREREMLGTLWELVENKHPACSYYQRLRATSHTRLRARDHYTRALLLVEKVEPV